MVTTVGFLGATFALSALAVYVVRGYARRRSLLDRPNERSAHRKPTPRLGGIGISTAFLTSASLWIVWQDIHDAWVIVLATGAMSLLGFLDDIRPLPAPFRFACQIVAAGLVVHMRWEAVESLLGTIPLPPVVLGAAVVMWIAWMTNLYNFMDGIDGLAAGQAVLAAAGLSIGALFAGSHHASMLLAFLACASAGFLLFNFPPASIFMGDVGSTAIGFFFACVPLMPGEPRIPVEAVWIAVGLFILDATTTLLRRIANGERFFQAHRSHWYQRPLALGVSHRRITCLAYFAIAPLALASCTYASAPTAIQRSLLMAPVLVFGLLVLLVRRLERLHVALAREVK